MKGEGRTSRLMHVMSLRLNECSSYIILCTVVTLLTCIEVLNLLAEGAPTLMIGIAREDSICRPVMLNMNEMTNMVLTPRTLGRARKNCLRLVLFYTIQGIMLHFLCESILQTFLKARVPN